MISPDLHFRDVLAFMCSNVFNFDFEQEDDTMRKSCKSDLVKQFENEVSPVFSLPVFYPSLTTYIRDSMDVLAFMCPNVFNFDFEIGL
jgi:hypothetical protein